jgi:hypothetical protein
VVQLDGAASHYGMPVFSPRRADQLTTQKIYRRQRSCFSSTGFELDCAVLGRKKLRWIAKTWIRKKPGLQNLDRKSWAAKVCDKKKKSAPAVTEALFLTVKLTLTVKFTLKFEL